ncbi:MAG: hypothetical protein KF716_32275 [Anaerolineae bacterium]|nr:hypothetical protein [Anaerolineae bacterium]
MSESTSFSKAEQPSRAAPLTIAADGLSNRSGLSSNGYSEQSSYHHTILAIHINDLERTTIDTWVQRNYELRVGLADITRPLFLQITFGGQIEAITPYAREKAREMNLVRPELPSVVAVVVPNSVIGQIIKMLIWDLSQTWQATNLRVFLDPSEAQVWLERQVDYTSTSTTPM